MRRRRHEGALALLPTHCVTWDRCFLSLRLSFLIYDERDGLRPTSPSP